MAKLTRQNYKKFTRQNLLPKTDGSKPYSAEANRIFQQNTELLEQFKHYYDSLATMRQKRERCKRYYFGDQLSDLMPNPDGCGMISEEEYMRKQGITPMSINIIHKAGKAILGVYCQSHYEPLAIARDRDEQKLGEMMSVAMEYAYQNRNLPESNTRGCEEYLISGITAFRVGYDKDQERKVSDITVNLCDINRMAWDENTMGQYFENINTIGYLHDMTIGEVLTKFAHSRTEKEQILQIYKDCQILYPPTNQQFEPDRRRRDINFYYPLSSQHCRVIEIWSKEQYDSYYCHDTAKGEQYYVSVEQEQAIIAENNRRVLEIVEAGGNTDDAALIEYQYSVEEKWTVRYLTPNGYVLHQSESPYQHGSHPFVIGAYPLVDGEVHSFVSEAINVQRMVNRLLMRIEYLRMNDAKGLYMVKKKILEESGMSLEEFAARVTSPNAVVALDWEGNENPVVQLHGQSNLQGDVQMLSNYMEMSNIINGDHGSLRGERPNSGTPASLYAQETENANNNIADMLQWYNGLIRKRDYKIMQVIQQYYTDRRYLNIAGKDYSEESKWYDPDKVRNSKFDLALVENQARGIFRAANENLLYSLLQAQQIDLQTYLESSTAPFADKLLERIKAKQEELAAAQQQALIQQGTQQPIQ